MATNVFVRALVLFGGFAITPRASGAAAATVGEPADVASSAYAYRADRPADQNPPENWLLLMQWADAPFDRPADPAVAPFSSPLMRKALCGLLWEEVRPIRRVELTWAKDERRPAVDQLALSYFDATDETAHTWWNPRTVKEAAAPQVSADGATYTFTIPVDTWGVVVALRGETPAAGFAAPTMHAYVPDSWKRAELEIEWGFSDATASLHYDVSLAGYDAPIADVRSLADGRHGLRCSVDYIGTSRWRRVWPYSAQPEEVARSLVTLTTNHGSFTFVVSDLELGPILAPEYGFFVRAVGLQPPPTTAPPSQLLARRIDDLPGIPLVKGWTNELLPWFGVNAEQQPAAAGSLTVPPRSAAMHPSLDRDAIVQWSSPITGRVRVSGRVAMADAHGGNGVAWSLAHERRAAPTDRRRLLAHGVVDTGARATIGATGGPAPEARPPLEFDVATGDVVALAVDCRNGDYVCDTTVVDLAVAEVGGDGRDWDLTRDVVDSIGAGNPHADRYGTAGVWSFASAAPDATPPLEMGSTATSARAFVAELAARGAQTIRARVRDHADATLAESLAAMVGRAPLPPLPAPPFEAAMKVEVPDAQLTAQWRLGAWHILRHSVQDDHGKWHFNDFPFGILSSETTMILRALDLLGMQKEAADGLDQWLRLPKWPRIVPGQNGHHALALPDRPLGHFSDGDGCFTHAEGPPGVGGNMDGVHAMGPGAIVFAMSEHFALTGDRDWLAHNIERIVENAEWIVRQRHLLTSVVPNGAQLWSAGLQPAHVVTPDSMSMRMQYYESEAYYWMAVARTAEMLRVVDRARGDALAAEAENYRHDLLAAIDRSIARTPVVAVRDGTYHSFIPFAPYVRGFAAGAWGWRRCQGHVGAIYWDTVQSADPLVSPSGLLSPLDPRVQGHLDVLEDRLLLENTHVAQRTPDFDADRDFFACASWQYQCGLERHANLHLEADDVPCFLRSLFNQYAVDLMPGEYTFREHTTAGPPDKVYEESCFLERFRDALIMEEGDTLWLARATPRAWLETGKRIAIANAPSHFGPVAYAIVSQLDAATHLGAITASVTLPSRRAPKSTRLRLRHPTAAPIKSVTVDGKAWPQFDRARETIELGGLTGSVAVRAEY